MAIDPVARGLGARALEVNSPQNSSPNTKRLAPSSLANLRAGIARVGGGDGDAAIAVIGTSITAGHIIGKAKSYPMRIAGRGGPISLSGDSFYGTANTGNFASVYPGGYSDYNSAVTLGSGWTSSPSSAPGGRSFQCPNTSTASLTFTPVGSCERFAVWYVKAAGFGRFTATVDGGAALTPVGGSNAYVDTSGATVAVAKAIFDAGSAGAHAISLQRDGTGGQINILGVTPYDEASPRLHIFNWGWIGGLSSGLVDAATAARCLPAMKTISQDAVIPVIAWGIELGANDYTNANGPVAISTFTANIQTLIDAAVEVGADPFLIAAPAGSSARQTLAIQQQYADAFAALAESNGIPIIDARSRWVDYDTADAEGMYVAADNIHPSAKGAFDLSWFGPKLLAL